MSFLGRKLEARAPAARLGALLWAREISGGARKMLPARALCHWEQLLVLQLQLCGFRRGGCCQGRGAGSLRHMPRCQCQRFPQAEWRFVGTYEHLPPRGAVRWPGLEEMTTVSRAGWTRKTITTCYFAKMWMPCKNSDLLPVLRLHKYIWNETAFLFRGFEGFCKSKKLLTR